MRAVCRRPAEGGHQVILELEGQGLRAARRGFSGRARRDLFSLAIQILGVALGCSFLEITKQDPAVCVDVA